MSLLDRIRNASINPFHPKFDVDLEPKAELNISGFELSVTRKDGILLTSRPAGDLSVEPEPASADFYYEVSVRPTGENREYPEREKPSLFRYTYGVKGDTSQGMVGSVWYIPDSYKFLKFELTEEFCKAGYDYGRYLPDHHSVYLHAHFRNANGIILHSSVSAWGRRSEKVMLDNYRSAPGMVM